MEQIKIELCGGKMPEKHTQQMRHLTSLQEKT